MKPYGCRFDNHAYDLAKQRASARRRVASEIDAQVDDYEGNSWRALNGEADYQDERSTLDRDSYEALGGHAPETALDVFYATKAMRDRATMRVLGWALS